MKGTYVHKTDEELYLLLSSDKKSSKLAFEELYSRYSAKIYTYCKKIMRNSAVAEDLYQDTFIKFYESAKSDRELTNVSRYLLKIARNLCLNEKLKKTVELMDMDEINIKYFDDSAEKKEKEEILEHAMQSLPDMYRESLILKEYMDLSYIEIAQTLDISLPMVRSRIFRAKEKLREILMPYLKEFKNDN